MPTITCPSCHERGKIPDKFVGSRIKCPKCGAGFQVTAPEAKPAAAATATATAASTATTPAPRQPQGDEIVVEGLDDAAWASAPSTEQSHPHDESPATFDPHVQGVATVDSTRTAKQYKVLTPRDRYFEGKFDLARLEDALNHFAREGWVVKGVATPHVVSFHGEKEELVIFLER